MKESKRYELTVFLLELVVYAVLVVGYFFLVLHFLGGWVHHLYAENRRLYAFVALVLIVGQGVLLEALTTALLNFVRARTGR